MNVESSPQTTESPRFFLRKVASHKRRAAGFWVVGSVNKHPRGSVREGLNIVNTHDWWIVKEIVPCRQTNWPVIT